MLKPYNELVKIDVLPFCDTRKAKDENKREIDVPYLNWAKCIDLLHENGAAEVWFHPLRADNGSYLFPAAEVTDKNGRKTGCWFVSVLIHIDDLEFTMDAPLLNGSLVVYEDTLNQLRISNCHARAFVKGVAIRTGLGFSLWLKEKDTDNAADDLYSHNIFAIKERVERRVTALLQRGMDMKDILAGCEINERQYKQTMLAFQNIDFIERHLKKL